MSITGEESGPPMKAGAALCDLGGVHLRWDSVGIISRGDWLWHSFRSLVRLRIPHTTTALGAYFQRENKSSNWKQTSRFVCCAL